MFLGWQTAYASIKPGLTAIGGKAEKKEPHPFPSSSFEVHNLCAKHKEKKTTASEAELGGMLDDSSFLSMIGSCIA